MSPTPHGVALLGGGLFARNAHLPALAETPTLLLKAVYSRSSASALSLFSATQNFSTTSHPISIYFDVASAVEDEGRKDGGLAELLKRDDIETVILSLPIPVQAGIIRECFRAGKNVISEKPVAKDLETAKELIELWEKEDKPRGVRWFIAEQFPYEPSFVRAQELVGTIGELRSFSLEYTTLIVDGTPSVSTAWRKNPTYQGGFLLDGGVHWVAAIRYILTGATQTPTLTAVCATASQHQPHLAPYDSISGILRTSTPGLNGTFAISFGQEGPSYRKYIFRGSKGVVTVDLRDPQSVEYVDYDDASNVVKEEFGGRAVKEEFLAFGLELTGTGAKVEERSGPREALKDLELIESALKSGEQGGWVDLGVNW